MYQILRDIFVFSPSINHSGEVEVNLDGVPRVHGPQLRPRVATDYKEMYLIESTRRYHFRVELFRKCYAIDEAELPTTQRRLSAEVHEVLGFVMQKQNG